MKFFAEPAETLAGAFQRQRIVFVMFATRAARCIPRERVTFQRATLADGGQVASCEHWMRTLGHERFARPAPRAVDLLGVPRLECWASVARRRSADQKTWT